jgi:hypothetical protein
MLLPPEMRRRAPGALVSPVEPEVPAVPIKSWSCPGCHRSFIVDSESAKDTCPWCGVAVEEKDGALRVVPSPAPAGGSPGTPGQPPPPGTSPAGSSAGSPGQGSGQNWWPFEYGD